MAGRAKGKLLAAGLALALTIAIGTASAGAAQTIILGAAKPANASCPDDCLVEARVTGFQTSIGNLKNPFVAPEDGEIVAWSLKQGKPNKADRRAFNEEFGPPKARIGILRQVPGTSNPTRYKLLRQSPVEGLGPFFGATTTFSLDVPLPIRKGEIVALTIKSWAPAFAVGQSAAQPANERRGEKVEVFDEALARVSQRLDAVGDGDGE